MNLGKSHKLGTCFFICGIYNHLAHIQKSVMIQITVGEGELYKLGNANIVVASYGCLLLVSQWMYMKGIFSGNKPKSISACNQELLWWLKGCSTTRENLCLFERMLSNVEITQDLAKIGWGSGVVGTASHGANRDPDLVPVGLIVDRVWHNGPHGAGCDSIWNLSRFRIMGKLSSVFLVGYFDTDFFFFFFCLWFSPVLKIIGLISWGAVWSFPLTLLPVIYEKYQVNHDKRPAESCLQNAETFFPLVLF